MVDVVKIKLTRGYYATVDEEDLAAVSGYNWRVNVSNGKFYAVRRRRVQEFPDGVKVGATISLHRFVLGIHNLCGSSIVGDHRDGDGLNCRRKNLRTCSLLGNGQNKGVWRRNTSSRYKGVFQPKGRPGRWQAYLHAGGKKKHIGTFDDELDAAKAYDVFAVKNFGEYARLNFEPGGVPF